MAKHRGCPVRIPKIVDGVTKISGDGRTVQRGGAENEHPSMQRGTKRWPRAGLGAMALTSSVNLPSTRAAYREKALRSGSGGNWAEAAGVFDDDAGCGWTDFNAFGFGLPAEERL